MAGHDSPAFASVRVAGQEARLWALALDGRSGNRGRRFLLLHGNPSHLGTFGASAAMLREHGAVALFDLPGFGASPGRVGPLSLDYFADVAAAYARSLGWTGDVDVLGHSHGGAVAQTLAVRHPGLVRSLVLLGSMGFPAHFALRIAMLPGAEGVAFSVARLSSRLPFAIAGRGFARALVRASFFPESAPAGFVDDEVARA